MRIPRKNTISCVMIVKNEETFLEKCLLSVKGWVDEIIIVDTGSDDDSINIARRFTEKLYFHPWEGSFSKARNQAMQYATGDWIFQIDGDEELIDGSGIILRDTVNTAGNADAFLVALISTYSNGQRTARHNFERLFRNNGIIRYESIVHNQVVGQRCTRPSKIEIMHYGYDLADEKKANEKFVRTTNLLKQKIAEDFDDPMPHHYLGTSYLSRGFYQECIAETEKAIELAERTGNDHPGFLWSHYNAAMAYYHLGDMNNAQQHALRAIRKFDGHMDSYHILTLVAFAEERWTDVQHYGDKYMERQAYYEAHSDKAGAAMNMTMTEGASVSLFLGHAWYMTGNRTKMHACYKKSEELANTLWETLHHIALFHINKTKDYTLAGIFLNKAFHSAPEEQKLWYSLANLAYLEKNQGDELKWLMKLHETGNSDEKVQSRLAVLLITIDNPAGAVSILEAILSKHPDNMQALINIGIAYKMVKNYEKSIESLMKVVERNPENPKPWYQLSQVSHALGKPEEADIFMKRAAALSDRDTR